MQKDQELRYKIRADKYRSHQKYDFIFTLLIAPEAYLDNYRPYKLFDHTVSYETIRDYFIDSGDYRLIFKAKNIINEAITKQRRGYTLKVNSTTTKIWDRINEAFSEHDISIISKKGPKPEGSSIVLIETSSINTLRRHLSRKPKLYYKMNQGFIDLEITKEAYAKSQNINLIPLLDSEMKLVKTGSSLAIRLVVEKIDMKDEIESQSLKIESAIIAVKKLSAWTEMHKVELIDLLH
jgi:hypothetical protein